MQRQYIKKEDWFTNLPSLCNANRFKSIMSPNIV